MDKNSSFKNEFQVNIDCTYQIAIFLVGFIGIQIISVIFALIFRNIMDVGGINFTVAVQSSTYATTLVCLIAILWPVIELIIPIFKHYEGYIVGVIASGAIILLEGLYVQLISLVPGYALSDNENRIRDMMTAYPLIMFVVACLLAPLVEETTYRLGLFSILKRKNKILAYAVTIIVFAAIHFAYNSPNLTNEFLNAPGYMIGAFVLTFTYDYYGLQASITAHAMNNIFAFLQAITILK